MIGGAVPLIERRKIRIFTISAVGQRQVTAQRQVPGRGPAAVPGTLQVGSKDDSLAMAHTEQLKKKFRGLKPEQLNQKLHELYLAGEQNLVFQVTSEIPVRDTLFNDRPNFVVDSIAFIPFSGDSVIMESTVKKVSGVNVPLFEASMPYKSLLKGLDNQLRINLDAEQEDKGRYKGLQVGSITAPNNNAGNWE